MQGTTRTGGKPKPPPKKQEGVVSAQGRRRRAASMAIAKQASDDIMDGEFCPFGNKAERVYIAMVWVWQFNFGGLPEEFC